MQFIKKVLKKREGTLVLSIIAMIIIFSLIDINYLKTRNLVDIIDQSVINGLLAVGITFAILIGGIDLSVGSSFAVVIVVIGNLVVMGVNPILALAIGVVLGALLGCVNGLIVTKINLQPFIATLGTMSIYRGIAYIITGGWPVLNIPSSFRNLLDGEMFGVIPIAIIVLIVFTAAAYFILKFTRIGTYVYSVGGNEEATFLSGINVDKTKIFAFVMSGIGAALAGMVLLAKLGAGEPTAGSGYELNAIAAAAIGGTSLSGGKGSVIGTFLGAILLSALKVGLVVVRVPTFWQFIATGTIIIVAASVEYFQNKLTAKSIG